MLFNKIKLLKCFDANFLKNTASLYLLTIARILFPLVTLPYLTRVLSLEIYGMVAYVKSVLTYVQIIVDFGFLLSATKDIVYALKAENNYSIMSIVSNTVLAKIFLLCMALIGYIIAIINIPILNDHTVFSLVMFMSIAMSIFLFDFYFQGIEEMSALATRFLWSKGFTTVCIFLFVHSDVDLMKMAYIELSGSVIAVILTFNELYKRNVYYVQPSIIQSILLIKESFMYFISNISTTVFNVFITFLIGIYLLPEDIAYWTIALQLIGGVQSFYSPILTSLYPLMVREKNIKAIFDILKVVMPLIFFGCLGLYIFASEIIYIIAGEKYIGGIVVFRYLIPLLFISFPAMIVGWPVLGAIGLVNQVTITTVFSSIVQVLLLVFLAMTSSFNLFTISISRCIVETFLFASRLFYVILYRRYLR